MTDRMTFGTRIKCRCAALLRQAHPEWTLEQIGDSMCVTKERARQYLVAAGAPTKCINKKPICRQCGGPVPRGRVVYCSVECHRKATDTTVYCDWCGSPITRIASLNKPYPEKANRQRNVHFCNRTCQGKWFGTLHGGGAQKRRRESCETVSET